MGPEGQNGPPKIKYHTWMDLFLTNVLQGKYLSTMHFPKKIKNVIYFISYSFKQKERKF